MGGAEDVAVMPRKLPSDDILVYLLTQGYRIAEIGRWYQVNEGAVRHHARRLGFPPGKHGGNVRHMQDRPKPQGIAA
jgi:hypothetical protein